MSNNDFYSRDANRENIGRDSISEQPNTPPQRPPVVLFYPRPLGEEGEVAGYEAFLRDNPNADPNVPVYEVILTIPNHYGVMRFSVYGQYGCELHDAVRTICLREGWLTEDDFPGFHLLATSGLIVYPNRNPLINVMRGTHGAQVMWFDWNLLGPRINRKGRHKRQYDRSGMRMQSKDIIIETEFRVQSLTARTAAKITKVVVDKKTRDYVIKLVEDVALLGYQLMTIPGKIGKLGAILAFVKLRIDGPLLDETKLEKLTSYFEKVFDEPSIQSADEFFTKARNFVDMYETLQNSPIYIRLHKFLMYSLATSMFEKVGITFDSLNYSKIEEEAIKKKYHKGADYIHCLLDTALFLAERGYQCMKTGSMSAIFHSGSTYEKWYDGVLDLQRKAKFLSNPEPHGFTVPEFYMSLDDHIEKGKAIARHVASKSEYEVRLARRALADLELVKATELTRRAASQDRKAPFSVLVFGGSGVAKSTFTKMLYYHYGKTFGLPTDSEYRYVRNANDPFWSGFTTAKWCIQLDDIAYLNPGAAPAGDPSVLEMLQVVNSVPFVPNQAELEDKGRTPVRAKFVVATSNADDLNAFHYFNCPLAVRRRLPYVIELKPKEKYAKDDVFLDAGKVPENQVGSYPDYWEITVKKVIPNGTGIRKQNASLKEIGTFSDIYEFCSWFSKAAKVFEAEQTQVEVSDKNMSEAVLCEVCYKPRTQGGCECATVQGFVSSAFYFVSLSLWTPSKFFIYWCFSLTWFVTLLQFLFLIPAVREGIINWIFSLEGQFVTRMFATLGEKHHRAMGKIKFFLNFSMLMGTAYTYFRIYKWLFGAREPNLTAQGGKLSSQIGRAPIDKGEEGNIWYNEFPQICEMDAAPMGKSWTQWSDEDIFNTLKSNVVLVTAYSPMANGQTLKRINRALAIRGQIYAINNHGLPEDGPLRLEIKSGTGDGISDNHIVRLSQEEIKRYPDYDVAFFELRGWAPRKDITNMFARHSMDCVANGFYIMINEQGHKEMVPMRAVKKVVRQVSAFGLMGLWAGEPARDTADGECGSPLIIRSGLGPFIAGLHIAGSPKYAASMTLTKELIDEALSGSLMNSRIVPGVPRLNVQSTNFVVGPLNSKSPFRFIKEGVAKLYGSFSGFRGRIRSRVCDTPIRALAEEYGYEVKTGAPVMNGWEPWYNAAIDMVNPVTNLKNEVLDQAKESFIDDILSRIDMNFLKEELFVYDDVTALNGAAGVRFVDKVNRNSSMGFPWKRSKRYYLEEAVPTESVPDPVDLPQEVWDRVDDCIETYLRGERYHPVFTGSLKDEPIKLSKIEEKKTRVFCASPIDWNIVVRKYCLAFVRVLQFNSFIFEAAPGIVCQSLEWDDLYKYLTRYGTERMIAGDYAAFDKRMPAAIILAAYDIIIAVCRASGNFTEDDLKVIQGIAMDTAFPLVDFNGDLVELSGSNPSGHPLTVIINCLANSLYLRYCYIELNPKREAKSFRDNVSAITYGDDNAMGCSDRVPWFTHTTLAKALEEIDIEYTMADKTTKSVPYIPMEEVSFLKRTWRWSEELNCWVAPLDESSIAKMLTKHIPSKVDCVEKQATDTLSTVVREYFWYGKTVFLQKKMMCEDIINRADLKPFCKESTLPTWKELCDDFDHRSERRVHKKW